MLKWNEFDTTRGKSPLVVSKWNELDVARGNIPLVTSNGLAVKVQGWGWGYQGWQGVEYITNVMRRCGYLLVASKPLIKVSKQYVVYI